MKKLFILLLLSLGFIGLANADHDLTQELHHMDYAGQSDARICSWFEVLPIPEGVEAEAEKRGLTCGGATNKGGLTNKTNKSSSNSSCNSSELAMYPYTCKCYANYVKRGDSCVKKIPPNAHASGSGWECNSGYRKNASFCELDVPDNAYPVGNDGRWSCKYGYSQSGMSCTKTYVPENAYLSSNTGWTCNYGYKRSGNSCVSDSMNSDGTCRYYYYKYQGSCFKLPPNSYKIFSSDSFKCNVSYKKSGNSCIKDKNYIPPNAYASGSSWKCNSGYKQSGEYCYKITIPPNAHASGSGWKCNSGYTQSSNSCIKKISIPPNAHASGTSWECNSGYQKSGNSCVEIPDDTIYSAGSGTGFAVTSDGHIVTNYHVIDGCTQVTVHNLGQSFITTTITQDPKNDLAILISDLRPSKFYPLSSDLYLADDIFVAGYPFGKRISSAVTINKGIVSALMGPGDDISKFQIDAGLNPGNSGGPVVDRMGNAVGVAVLKLNPEKAKEELGSVPELFNFAVNSMMVIGLFKSQGIELPVKNKTEQSVQERSNLFNRGTFYLACGMTIAQYEKMEKTNKVMFTREVVFSDLELD